MSNALQSHGLGNLSAAHFGGTSFWIEGPENLDVDILAKELSDQSVLVEPGTPFFNQKNPPKNFFRIAYSSISVDNIPEGVALISRTIEANSTKIAS